MQPLSELLSVWTTTRAAGMTAYLLLFASTAAGLMMSGKLSGKKSQAVILAIHQWTGWFGFLFGALHGVVLLFDDYVGYSALELAVPFASDDHRWLIGIGTLSLYISAILIASSDMMKKLGRKLWRAIHFLAFAGFGMALLHGILIGTDTSSPVISGMYAVTAFTIVALTAYRIYSSRLHANSSAKEQPRNNAVRESRVPNALASHSTKPVSPSAPIEYIPPADPHRIPLRK